MTFSGMNGIELLHVICSFGRKSFFVCHESETNILSPFQLSCREWWIYLTGVEGLCNQKISSVMVRIAGSSGHWLYMATIVVIQLKCTFCFDFCIPWIIDNTTLSWCKYFAVISNRDFHIAIFTLVLCKLYCRNIWIVCCTWLTAPF